MKKKNSPQNQEDAFILEVNEELKNERIRDIWNRYGLYIVAVVIIALTAAVSFETFKSWHDKKYQKVSDVYAVAVAMQNQGKYDESLRILQDLEKNAGNSIYEQLAVLQSANILAEQDKMAEAADTLQKFVSRDDVNKSLRDVAIIKLASYQLENKPYEEIETMLKPLIEENGNWTAIAQEMLAMAAIYAKNFEQAQELYGKIAASDNAPEELKSRAKDMLLILEEETK